MRRHQRRGWGCSSAVALLVAVVGSCGDGGDRQLAGVVREPPLAVGTVSLPDVAHGGSPMPMRAPAGELHLVYFGYTSCPDICPTTMSDISRALDALSDGLAVRVTTAMVTVDPERDTDEVLTTYLDHFFDRSYALRTTDLPALEAAADAFGVLWEVAAHAPGATSYDVAHTATTYVVDDTGTVVVEWPFGLDATSMTSDLTALLDKEP